MEPIKFVSGRRAPPVIDQGEPGSLDIGLGNFFADVVPRSPFVGAVCETKRFAVIGFDPKQNGVRIRGQGRARETLLFVVVAAPGKYPAAADIDTHGVTAPAAVD